MPEANKSYDMAFLTEDEITDSLLRYFVLDGWSELSRAKGHARGTDLVVKKDEREIHIEAKGGGSQTKTSKNFGKPFSRLQCQIHTDVAFATIAKMQYNLQDHHKSYCVGIVLPNDVYHCDAVRQFLPAIKKLGAGAWLVDLEGKITVLSEPIF